MDTIPPLSRPLHGFEDLFDTKHTTLPPILPRFFVPRLPDKPTNPIAGLNDIVTPSINGFDTRRATYVRRDIQEQKEQGTIPTPVKRESEGDEIWTKAARVKSRTDSGVLSWDTLNQPVAKQCSPFLSEQGSYVLSAIRYHVNPPILESVVYVSEQEVLENLQTCILGVSSPLYHWDAVSEKFVVAGGKSIVIERHDVSMSESLTARFLEVGAQIRRIELFTEAQRSKATTVREGPTLHAFCHAMNAILHYVRTLNKIGSSNESSEQGLAAAWVQLEPVHAAVSALASFCQRDIAIDPTTYPTYPTFPTTYPTFPTTPSALITTIYNHLEYHSERYISHLTTALFAFLLTQSSVPFIDQICASVGYRKARDSRGRDEEDEGGDGIRDEELDAAFLPEELREILPRARRSLALLSSADREVAYDARSTAYRPIRWVWTDEDVAALCNEEDGLITSPPATTKEPLQSKDLADPSTSPSDDLLARHSYKPELSTLSIFDYTPGSHLPPHTHLTSHTHAHSHLTAFLTSFAPSLPNTTPTLPILTSLIFSPLITHARSLASSLCALFLSSSDTQNFRAHLRLLRGYMLMTDWGFRERLGSALFSDRERESGEGEIGSFRNPARVVEEDRRKRRRAGSRSQSRSRGTRTGSRGSVAQRVYGDGRQDDEEAGGHEEGVDGSGEEDEQEGGDWPVGLALSLIQRETWPPYGADLSFSLRAVIVDSVAARKSASFSHRERDGVSTDDGQDDDDRQDDDEDDDAVDVERKAMECVYAEAEVRLGFAVRDLDAMEGDLGGWRNPFSIESLDFLYMDYQPPPTLGILITPTVLSKYQRIFTLLLRIMRVENALIATHRLTNRQSATPIFETLDKSNKLLLHFRFAAHSFVTSLSSYITDVAIRSLFDSFLDTLSPSSPSSSSATNASPGMLKGGGNRTVYTDAFMLGERHSEVLDEILSACLLRSAQRKALDLVCGALEICLTFAVLVGRASSRGGIGRRKTPLEEVTLAKELDELFRMFRKRMKMLVRVLKALVDRAGGGGRESFPGAGAMGTATDLLSHLVLRLTMNDWWAKAARGDE